MTRVLIVDDKPENLYVLRALLQGHGCTVDEARHGAEALVLARQNLPQLIISDLLMPVMDGYSLLRQWKADDRLKAIPFIVYTATYTEAKDEKLALDLGADAFILKPAEPDQFMVRMRQVLEQEKRGELLPAHEAQVEEKVQLREYSEVLIRKLEEKALQLEQANRALQEDIVRRQRVEEALRTSESRLRTILDMEPECVKLLDGDSKLLEMNRAGLVMIEADSAAQVQSCSLLELVSPEYRQAFRALSERVFQGESGKLEFEITGLKGSRRWLETHAAPLRDSSGAVTAFLGVTRDITEQRRAEKALRESQQRLTLATESAHIGIWDWDVVANKLVWDTRMVGLYGLGKEDFGGAFEAWHKGVHPEDRDRAYADVSAALDGVRDFHTQFRVLWPNGEVRHIEAHGVVQRAANGSALRMIGANWDITERTRAEEAVRASNRRLRELIDGLGPNLFVALVTTDGVLIEANRPALEAARLKPEDVLGKPFDQTYWWTYSKGVQQQLREAIERAVAGTPSRYDVQVRVADGALIWIDFSIYPLRDQAGRVVYLVPSAAVIDARKQAENSLRASEERFRSLVEQAADAIFIAGPDGRFLEANSRATEMFGYAHDEFIGLAISEVVSHEVRPRQEREFRAVLQGGQLLSERPFRRRDGTEFPGEISACLLSDGRILGIVRDITQRKRIEAALLESEERLRLFIGHAPAALAMFDQDMRYIAVSRRWLTDYGLGGESIVGRSHYEVFPEIPVRWKAVHRRALKGETVRADEDRFVRTDGSVQWLRWEVRPWRAADDAIGGIVIFTEDVSERKRAEQSLRESELRFRSLVEQAADGIAITNEEGWYQDANLSFCAMIGYTRDELLRMQVGDIVVPEERTRVAPEIAHIAAGEPYLHEWRLRRKDGTIFPIEVNGRPLPDGRLLGIIRDISERQQAQALLEESQQRLALATESAHIGIWDWDVVTNKLTWDTRMYALYGIRAQDFGGAYEAWEKGLHPEDRERAVAEAAAALQGARDYHTEFRVMWPSGEVRHIEAHGVVQRADDGSAVRMIGANWDITERKLTEEALRKSQESLEAAQEHAKLGSWDLNLETQTGSWSLEQFRLFDCDPEQGPPTFTEFLEMLHPMDQQTLLQHRSRLIQSGEPANFDFRTNPARGPVRHMQVTVKVVKDAQGTPVQFVGTTLDITERKHAEEQLQQSKMRLQALSRKLIEVQEAERRHLARELHDELGQVLTMISVNLKAARQKLKGAVQSRVDETIGHVDGIIQQVRSISLDLRPAMLDDLGLAAALRWYAERQAEQSGLQVDLVTRSTAGAVPTEVRNACFRVAQEALTNIVRYGKARLVRVELVQCEDEVELTVQDDGVGFDVAAAHARAAQGKSVGLLSMQERVELLGGRFDIRSAPGQGTTVHARFPLPVDGTESELYGDDPVP